MPISNAPLVSLLLPLYKSGRFLDIILQNLQTLEYRNLEILVSDRHCADDAIELLQARYGQDTRFRFFRARDELAWFENYNFLLSAATGKYFFWMPHDDSFPAHFVDVLVEALEKSPHTLIAFGRMEALYSDGTRKMLPEQIPSLYNHCGLHAALEIYLRNALWLLFHGLVRREELLDTNLMLRPTQDGIAADLVWDFAAAMLGRVKYVPNCAYQKRYYPTSTHALWKKQYNVRHLWSEVITLYAYVNGATSSPMRAATAALCWASLRGGRMLLTWLHLYPRFHPALRDTFLTLARQHSD